MTCDNDAFSVEVAARCSHVSEKKKKDRILLIEINKI